MIEIIRSATFDRWLSNLRDRQARVRILARLRRAADGNLGDYKLIGDGIFEMRLTFGPGYRLYFIRQGSNVIVLLCGGDKSSQARDIERARVIAQEWRN